MRFTRSGIIGSRSPTIDLIGTLVHRIVGDRLHLERLNDLCEGADLLTSEATPHRSSSLGPDMRTIEPLLFKKIDARLAVLPDGSYFLVILAPLLVVYLLTASWTTVKSPDPLTNAIAAWNLGTEGTVILDEHHGLENYSGQPTWIVDSPDGPVSKFPPGAALLAAPLYAFWPGDGEIWTADDPRRWDDAPIDVLVPPLGPAVLISALSTALAISLAGLTARGFVGSLTAVAGSYVYGLGTGAWAVAADTLWQHGPAMLWLALGVWLASKDREWLSGVAFGAGSPDPASHGHRGSGRRPHTRLVKTLTPARAQGRCRRIRGSSRRDRI